MEVFILPDITMCSSEHCLEKSNCYRHTAKPSVLQSWADFLYTCNEGNGFPYYIPNSEVDNE